MIIVYTAAATYVVFDLHIVYFSMKHKNKQMLTVLNIP